MTLMRETHCWCINNEPTWLHGKSSWLECRIFHCSPWKHLLPFASISHRTAVFTHCEDLQAVISHVHDEHVHIAMRTSWYNVSVCVCVCVLLMPEHSLSPSQTLETAWPFTRRLTRLWLKTSRQGLRVSPASPFGLSTGTSGEKMSVWCTPAMSMHWVYEWLQCVLDLVSNILNTLSTAETGE